MAEHSDADVMARSVTDPEAFGAIFDRHAVTLLRYLVRRVGRDDAETLLGELFRIAFERRDRFDTVRETARPWLYGIASNLLLKQRRSEARRLKAVATLAAKAQTGPGADETVVDGVHARARLLRVAHAIEELPDGERDALLLFVWEEQSYEDVADALDVPVGTVRSRLNRARTKLRQVEREGSER